MNENAKKDLKEGLRLYNTENNVGLKNAWNIIQAEVRAPAASGKASGRRGGGRAFRPPIRWRLPEQMEQALYHGIQQKRDEEVSTEARGPRHRSGQA